MLYHIDDLETFTGLNVEGIEMMRREYGADAENIVKAVAWAAGEPAYDFASMLPNLPYSNQQIYKYLCVLNDSLARDF